MVALATRGEAPLPLARLRAQQRLVELGAGRLAMTREETAGVLGLGDRRFPADELDTLVRLTEGWPGGLSLALIALADGRVPAQLSGADPYFADYLHDEILSALTPAERVFLRRSSVLETLSGPACDIVLERTGSAAVLARLARTNVLLVPLDRRGERYRLHALLGDALAEELARVEPGRADGLHRRASDWCRRAEDVDGAVRHALAAHDDRHAAALIWASAASAVAHGDAGAVERRLARFSERRIATTPELALAAATLQLLAGRGDLVSHWASAAAVRGRRPTRRRRCSAAWPRSRAALGHDGLPRVIEDAARGLAQLPGDDVSAALCQFVAGAAHHLLGDREAATDALAAGARRAAVAAPALHALCLAQLGVLAVEREDWAEASELVTRARAQIDRHHLEDAPVSALVFAAAAVVRAHDGPRRRGARATSPPPRGCRRGWWTSRPGTTPSCGSSAAGRPGACATCPTRSRACSTPSASPAACRTRPCWRPGRSRRGASSPPRRRPPRRRPPR